MAAQDAAELARALARGDGRLFRVGLYVTVRAASVRRFAVTSSGTWMPSAVMPRH